MKCTSCNNVQAQELVEADLMFRDYWYRSSTTGTMRDHLKDIVERIIKPGGAILDIGSNDGVGLLPFKNLGLVLIDEEHEMSLMMIFLLIYYQYI